MNKTVCYRMPRDGKNASLAKYLVAYCIYNLQKMYSLFVWYILNGEVLLLMSIGSESDF